MPIQKSPTPQSLKIRPELPGLKTTLLKFKPRRYKPVPKNKIRTTKKHQPEEKETPLWPTPPDSL